MTHRVWPACSGGLDMALITEPRVGDWTAADLVARFGPIPLRRIRHDPPPGTATEDDVVRIHDHEDRLYELADGVLVEKTVGTYESYLAGVLLQHLGVFVTGRKLGIVLPPDGMVRLSPGLVRIPDVSFISSNRLPGRRVPRAGIAPISPDLAVEVISRGNTEREMEDKLDEYFAASVRLVWYVYPIPREVKVYSARDQCVTLREEHALTGGEVLPGFSLSVRELFAEPILSP